MPLEWEQSEMCCNETIRLTKEPARLKIKNYIKRERAALPQKPQLTLGPANTGKVNIHVVFFYVFEMQENQIC